jgi:predicted transposase YbfD/YdcC
MAKRKRLVSRFAEMKDPRIERMKLHDLMEIIVIAICAVISWADTCIEAERFGKIKYKWFRKFLKLENGIPSHDRFGRVFSLIDPEEFKKCFIKWIESISERVKGNQGTLQEEKFKGVEHDHYKTLNKDHGRIEKRECWITSDIDWLYAKSEWKDLKSIGLAKCTRTIEGNTTTEIRYYISSLDSDAKKFGETVRSHWGIENSLH